MSVEKIIEEMGVMDIQIEDNILNRPIRLDDYLRKELVRRFPAIAIYYLEKVRENKYTRKKARLSRIALTSMVLREYWSNMDKSFEQSQGLIPLDLIISKLKAIYSETNELYNIADQVLKDKIAGKILDKGGNQREDWSRDYIKADLKIGDNKEGLTPKIIKTYIQSVFSKLYVITKNGEFTYKLVPRIDKSPKNAGKNKCILIPVRDISREVITPYDYAVTSHSPLHLARYRN